MKFARRFIAAAVLVGWLFAIGHLVLEHGASAYSGVDHELFGHDEDHHDEDSEHHHHDLGVLPAGPLAKATDQKALVPVWELLCDALYERLTVAQRCSSEPGANGCLGNAPPDARASGWLLICHTAQPVRGPSLIA